MAGVVYAMKQISLFLVAKCLAVADEKFKIACIRLIDPRKINFINDAMAEGEPEGAASGICSPKTFLCAGRPTRLNSGRPKRRAIDLSVHGETRVLEISYSTEPSGFIASSCLIIIVIEQLHHSDHSDARG